jgi:hypothetical protein
MKHLCYLLHQFQTETYNENHLHTAPIILRQEQTKKQVNNCIKMNPSGEKRCSGELSTVFFSTSAKLSETYEKFYTTDVSNTAATAQHSAMGISTLAKFSMLSNTPTLFKVRRPGLNNAVNTVSFQSLQKPGFFLRHKDYKFHMEKDDGTDLFRKEIFVRYNLL